MIRTKQNGLALLAIVAMVLLASTSYFIATLSINQQRIDRVHKNAAALATAKEALLGYALSQTPAGILPCPDQDADGQSDMSGASCATQRGFLPTQTLKISPLYDSSGARLWYAVELDYTEESGGTQLNSSLSSSLRVNSTAVVAAVVIAPGPELANQSRINNSVGEYLEEENADANTTLYVSDKTSSNNDEVLTLPIGEFWSLIEKRVLRNAANELIAYRNTANCGHYPFAANRTAPYDSQPGLEVGTLPLGTALPAGMATGCPASVSFPSWIETHWPGELHYALCGPSGSGCLTVSGDRNTQGDALVIGPGAVIGSQIRPSSSLSQYFEADNSDSDFNFVYYSLSNHSGSFNDTLYLFDE